MENTAAASPLVGAGDAAAEGALIEAGRAVQRRVLAAQADQLRYALAVLAECEAQGPQLVHGSDFDEFVRRLAGDEIACTLGISLLQGRDLLWLAERVATLMPSALDALSQARLDLPRLRVLVETTSTLTDELAAQVAADLVAGLDQPVWDGPTPRAWRARVQRAVVRADQHAAERRRQRALAARAVQAWAQDDGMGVLQVRTDALDVALIDTVLTDLAHARPHTDPATGEHTTLDQRRADALTDLCRAVRDAASLPSVPVRRVHDLGLVVHADTLYDDGPRANALGQLRGLGTPAPLDPASTRTLAVSQLRAGTAVQVLLVDHTGAVAHVIALADPATACATRTGLHAAVRSALEHPPPQSTDRYHPTIAITRHVLAEAPTCSFPDCNRRARACDLDHNDPWPRGPTAVINIDPKCRPHHQGKTHALVRSTLRTGPGQGPRHTTWTLRNGLQITTRPEPLPGCDD